MCVDIYRVVRAEITAKKKGCVNSRRCCQIFTHLKKNLVIKSIKEHSAEMKLEQPDFDSCQYGARSTLKQYNGKYFAISIAVK